MENKNTYDFFLGASCGDGFRSLFAQSYDVKDAWRAYIIKGGPGTGKSTLMKKLAAQGEKLSMTVERCYCSSDINSLDAVILPEIKTAIMDGTSPHVVEPANPGICEKIIDVTTAWDISKLRENRMDILNLSQQCSACHKAAQASLKAAAVFNDANLLITDKYINEEKIKSCASRLMSVIGKVEKGMQSRRLLSAVSGGGVHFFANTMENRFSKVIAIEDRHSRCAGLLLGELKKRIDFSSYNAYICCCSQSPEKTEHILLPSSSLAFTTANRFHCIENAKMIHASRFMTTAPDAQERRELIANEKKRMMMIDEAGNLIAKAKKIHDELEALYISAVDFDIVDSITQKTISEIFS